MVVRVVSRGSCLSWVPRSRVVVVAHHDDGGDLVGVVPPLGGVQSEQIAPVRWQDAWSIGHGWASKWFVVGLPNATRWSCSLLLRSFMGLSVLLGAWRRPSSRSVWRRPLASKRRTTAVLAQTLQRSGRRGE